jgi:zinc-ribbon domain
MIRCSNCGAPVEDPSRSNCAYCGVFILKLSTLEIVHRGAEVGKFRSLRALYTSSLVLGGLMAFAIYFVLFNHLSETQLVSLSPLWFLAVVFGGCGFFAERAVHYTLSRRAETFGAALKQVAKDLPPLPALFVGLLFTPPFLLFGAQRRSSPFVIAIITTALWALCLYFFLFGIFPSL